MEKTEALLFLRSNWIRRITHYLAHAKKTRDSLLPQLNLFYDGLQNAVETGDFRALELLLDEWIAVEVRTDLENQETSLPPIISRMMLEMFDVMRSTLSKEDTLELTKPVLTVFAHTIEYTTGKETRTRIDHIMQELEKAQVTLERLDRSKSDFISIAAHELKTPLTLIEGYAAMLREQFNGSQEQFQADLMLKGVDTGTRRLREIVDDMIDVSKIDNDLLSLNFQPVWFDRILLAIQLEFQKLVAERQQVLEVITFPGCEEMTFADEERLHQAIKNVVNNAMKYTPDGGRITIDGRKLPGFIEITLTDTGIGIDPEDQERIFEKFGQLGNVALHSSGRTKFKGGGPGLGLAISKGIIEAHRGTIWVESEGCDEQRCPGSTFHILLPILQEPPDDKSAKLFRSLIGSRKQVLNGKENS